MKPIKSLPAKPPLFALLLGVLLQLQFQPLHAADPIFSGPQNGEKTTPFKVLELTGAGADKERDPVTENAGAATAFIFVHGIERSLVPLLRTVDQYGLERKDRLRTEIIFLSGDKIEGAQRIKAAAGSLKLQSRIGLSPDGIEGPGNYGLNKDCLMTIVTAKDNVVTANFALVQPGIADAPKVIAALAKTCGDESPPPVEELGQRQAARSGGGGRDGGGDMRRGERMRPGAPPVDLSKFDLNNEAGLRDAVRALIGEVQSLRAELAAVRGAGGGAGPPSARPPQEIPGAVPTDDTLQGLLRRFIRPANDDATVDEVLKEVRAHIKDNPDLKKQAKDGWTRVLHFENYGTPYARKTGRAFLEELQRESR